MRDKLALLGIVFGIATIFLSISIYYLIFFSTTYLLSLIFTWLSKKSLKHKIIWTLIPIFAGALFMAIIGFAHDYRLKKKSLKLKIVLEENFTGEVIVYANSVCGQEVIKEDSRYVLKIPDDGVLFYSGDLNNDGYIDNLFFRKKNSSYDTIPSLDRHILNKSNKINSNTLGVWRAGHYSYSSNQRPDEMFIITTKNKHDSIDWYRKIDKKIKQLSIINCEYKPHK